ncbi:MAG: AEC family transporter, partial [Hyphomicrobium sp.]
SVPCALFAVGFTLAGFRIAGETRALAVSAVLKNFAMPALAWVVTVHAFGLPPLPAMVITLFAAMPTGTATYLFASQNGLAVETTSASVALSTAISMITLPFVLLWLGQP